MRAFARYLIGCSIAVAIVWPLVIVLNLSETAAVCLGFVMGMVCVFGVGVADEEWFS